MNNQEQVSKLQSLLARIQRNATQARGSAPLPPPAAFAPPPAFPVAPPPVAAAAPAPYSPPPAAAYAPPPPPTFEEQSIDDLLGVSEPPPPLDIDVPLETLPPVADTSASAPEADPIPLVSVAPHESVPPPEPYDASFSLDSEVSEVRVSTLPRDFAPEVTVAAIEAEAEPMATEELSEEDLVDVTEGTPIPATDLDIDFTEEEQPPASSQRQVASSMDEALASAVSHVDVDVDVEREVPLKTPPPESGPQAAPLAAITAPPAPEVDSLLGEELEIPTRGDSVAAAAAPTPEQLGQTIDLEEAAGPSLELAEPAQSTTPPAASEELEVALPSRDIVGGYDDSLLPPPEARDDLDAHRRRLEEDIAPPPESLATLPSTRPGYAPEIVPLPEPVVEVAALQALPIETTPEIIARATPQGSPEAFATVREPFRPSTFVELLDASLSLGG